MIVLERPTGDFQASDDSIEQNVTCRCLRRTGIEQHSDDTGVVNLGDVTKQCCLAQTRHTRQHEYRIGVGPQSVVRGQRRFSIREMLPQMVCFGQAWRHHFADCEPPSMPEPLPRAVIDWSESELAP